MLCFLFTTRPAWLLVQPAGWQAPATHTHNVLFVLTGACVGYISIGALDAAAGVCVFLSPVSCRAWPVLATLQTPVAGHHVPCFTSWLPHQRLQHVVVLERQVQKVACQCMPHQVLHKLYHLAFDAVLFHSEHSRPYDRVADYQQTSS
jgi:hypothetical protein